MDEQEKPEFIENHFDKPSSDPPHRTATTHRPQHIRTVASQHRRAAPQCQTQRREHVCPPSPSVRAVWGVECANGIRAVHQNFNLLQSINERPELHRPWGGDTVLLMATDRSFMPMLFKCSEEESKNEARCACRHRCRRRRSRAHRTPRRARRAPPVRRIQTVAFFACPPLRAAASTVRPPAALCMGPPRRVLVLSAPRDTAHMHASRAPAARTQVRQRRQRDDHGGRPPQGGRQLHLRRREHP